MIMKRGWIGLAAVIVAVGCSNKDTIDPGVWNSYRNPVEQTEVQDPAVYEDNGTFYLFASGTDDSIIPMMVSSNLTRWELAISVFNDETKPSFINGVSADKPSVAKVGDNYLLYYSLYKTGENCGIGVAVANLVTGPYMDLGKLIVGSDYGISGAVSPSFFNDGDSNYLVFGNFGGIYVVELSEDGKSLAAGAAPVKVASELFDAPCIKVKDGRYYLFASIGSTAGGADCTCQQVVGRSESVYGPYFDKNSRAMTDDGYEVLIKSSTKFTGPGHGCVFDTPDGATWIIYNAFDLSDVSKGRTLMLDRVNWMEDWPSVRGSIGSFSADAPALN